MPKNEFVPVGDNVEATVEGDTLILRINLKAETRPSAPDKMTGISKSDVLASTRGNRPLVGLPNLGIWSLGVNLYKARR